MYFIAHPIVFFIFGTVLYSSRVSVIRGQVISREGNGLIGIRVSVATDPQFGFTLTRGDGWYESLIDSFIPNTNTKIYKLFSKLWNFCHFSLHSVLYMLWTLLLKMSFPIIHSNVSVILWLFELQVRYTGQWWRCRCPTVPTKSISSNQTDGCRSLEWHYCDVGSGCHVICSFRWHRRQFTVRSIEHRLATLDMNSDKSLFWSFVCFEIFCSILFCLWKANSLLTNI